MRNGEHKGGVETELWWGLTAVTFLRGGRKGSPPEAPGKHRECRLPRVVGSGYHVGRAGCILYIQKCTEVHNIHTIYIYILNYMIILKIYQNYTTTGMGHGGCRETAVAYGG